MKLNKKLYSKPEKRLNKPEYQNTSFGLESAIQVYKYKSQFFKKKKIKLKKPDYTKTSFGYESWLQGRLHKIKPAFIPYLESETCVTYESGQKECWKTYRHEKIKIYTKNPNYRNI